MTIEEMLKKVDHTNLSVTATSADIEKLCKEAILFNTAGMYPASFVSITKSTCQTKVVIPQRYAQ